MMMNDSHVLPAHICESSTDKRSLAGTLSFDSPMLRFSKTLTKAHLTKASNFCFSPSLSFPFSTMAQQGYSTQAPKPPHFITTADYTAEQLLDLVHRAIQFKVESKYNHPQPRTERPLSGKTLALMFSKRSTRTRVATETATAYLGKYFYAQQCDTTNNSVLMMICSRWSRHVPGFARYSIGRE